MPLGEVIRFSDPDNQCFGCGQHNEHGLRMSFVHATPHGVETTYVAPAHTCGSPGIVHGGVQAAILDEAVGFAVHAYHETVNGTADTDDPEWQRVVTVEFDLRYRKPVPSETPLTIRAEVLRVTGRDYLAAAEILDADEQVLTSATAKWRRIG
jgi:acyl-coenzyme A thioesterase PaaI-like protein